MLARLLWIGVACIGLLLPLPSSTAIYAMLAMYLLISLLESIAGPAWWTWMADLIPRRIRGRYMATREIISTVFRLAGFVIVGIILDIAISIDGQGILRAPASAALQPILKYTICGLFILAGLLGLPVLLFRRVREVLPSVNDMPRAQVLNPDSGAPLDQSMLNVRESDLSLFSTLARVLLDPWRIKSFRYFAISTAVLMFGANISAMYLVRNALNNIGFSKLSTNAIFLIFGAIGGLLTLKAFGRLVDRFGRNPVLIISAIGTVFTILPWAFITRNTPDLGISTAINWLGHFGGGLFGHGELVLIAPDVPLGAFIAGAIASTVGGIAWAGIGQAQASYLLGFSDLAGRSKFIAAFAVFSSVGGMLGGLTGGVLTQQLEFLQTDPIVLGPIIWNNWHIAFLASGTFRLVALGMLMNLREPSAGSTKDLLVHLSNELYRRTIGLLPGLTK